MDKGHRDDLGLHLIRPTSGEIGAAPSGPYPIAPVLASRLSTRSRWRNARGSA